MWIYLLKLVIKKTSDFIFISKDKFSLHCHHLKILLFHKTEAYACVIESQLATKPSLNLNFYRSLCDLLTLCLSPACFLIDISKLFRKLLFSLKFDVCQN